MVFRQSAEAAEAEAAALAALYVSGSVKVYSGTRPATVATALGANTLLASFPFGATPWTAGAVDGVYTASGVPNAVTAVATGTATFARAFKSDGTTAITDVDAGTTGTELILASTSIVSGTTVTLTAYTITFAL